LAAAVPSRQHVDHRVFQPRVGLGAALLAPGAASQIHGPLMATVTNSTAA